MVAVGGRALGGALARNGAQRHAGVHPVSGTAPASSVIRVAEPGDAGS
jgi:hypothetical protein